MRSRTRLRISRASILALVSALFGCGLTTNLDGLSGGGTAGANVEAGLLEPACDDRTWCTPTLE